MIFPSGRAPHVRGFHSLKEGVDNFEHQIYQKEFEKLLTEKLFNEFAIDIASATDEQIYRALALIARGMLSESASALSRAPTATSTRCITCAWNF